MKELKISLMVIFISIFNLIQAQETEFKKWLEKDKQEYQNFLEKEDKAFAEFLKKDWQGFKAEEGIKPLKEPKPIQIPSAPVTKEQKESIISKKVEIIPGPPKPEIKTPVHFEKPAEIKNFNINYYGLELPFPLIEFKKFDYRYPLNEEKISNIWLTIANTNHKPLIESIKNYQNKLNLNDYALLELVNNISRYFYDKNLNSRLLYNWFILNKLGYNAKIAYKDNQVILLLPSKTLIYDCPSIVIDNQRFYAIRIEGNPDIYGMVKSYKGVYNENNQPIDLFLSKLPELKPIHEEKELTFTYNEQNIRLKVIYDRNFIRFLMNYPRTEYQVYFKSSPTNYLDYSLINELKNLIIDKTEIDAVNLLLRFVQTAFVYKTDKEQFGYEKCLFPDETIFYEGSDCEDRAILFAYLVRRLLGLEVIGLDYPNHVATAVLFSDKIVGDKIEYKGKEYLICDPTYVNANAGLSMPRFRNVKPEIIELK